MSLFSPSKSAFGLDVSGSSLKVFELGKVGDKSSVKAYSSTPFPKGLVAGDVVTDNTTFEYLLKQTLEKPQFGSLTSNRAVVCLPESKSFVRVIQIPRMSEVEAESAVPFEAESFIPLPIDQVYLDWQRLGDAGEGKMDVLIVASPREYVDKYIGLLEKGGVKIVAMEVESQSCVRALVQSGMKETLLIVDLDAYRSSLIMVEDGSLQFTSTVPIAGNMFTESIARTLGVSSAKAEMIKRKVGIANTTEYPNIQTSLAPVLNNLTAEIKNILKFHNDHSDKQVSRILFTGGSAKLKNLVGSLSPGFADMPGLKLELGNPWLNLSELQNPPMESYDALNYTTAIGLAERNSNRQK